MAERISELFGKYAEWLCKNGHENLNATPGLHVSTLGDFTFRLNPHDDTIESVPPFHAGIDHQGFPLGLVGPYGGMLMAGAEGDIIAVLDKALAA